MEAVVLYPANETELNLIIRFAADAKLTSIIIGEDSKQKIAGIELSKLASKNPKAYATDEEIISVVEEARQERDMEKEIKVIIADTNWWISLIIQRFNNKFAEILPFTNLKFITSLELTEEIKSTLSKDRLQKHLTAETVNSFWPLYTTFVTEIDVSSVVSICRDPKDNFLLALAKDANADFLITGDKDLLVLEKFEQTTICTLTDFIDKYLNT